MRVSRRAWIAAGVALGVAAWPSRADALPTPDAIIGTVQVLPVLLGAVGAGGAWLGRRLWKVLGGDKDARKPLATMAIVLGVAWVVTAVALADQWSQNKAHSGIENVASYVRCDLILHEHRLAKTIQQQAGKLLPRVKIQEATREINAGLASDPSYNPLLLSSLNSRTMYESGFIGVGSAERRRYFEFVPGKELPAYLTRIPAAERAKRDVFLELYALPEHDVEGLEALLREFKSARVIDRQAAVRGLGKEAEYGPLFVREEGGKIRPAVFTPEATRDWPVRREKQYYDETHIRFPNMTTLLSAEEAKHYAHSTPVIMTYGTVPIERGMAVEFAMAMFEDRLSEADKALDARKPQNTAHLFEALRKADVYVYDIIGVSDAELNTMADAIGDREFMLVPLTTLAWVHGNDLPRLLARRARERHAPFRYVGATLQMPEVVAQMMLDMKASSASGALRDQIRDVLVTGIDKVASAVHSTGGALLLIGFGLRLLMLPLSVNARRVKIAQKRFDGSQREFLTRMGAAKRHLRLGALYEMPGAFANMLFLVPFFAAPTERLAGRSFGMIADLGKPNLLVSVVLGVEFAVLATLMFPSEGRKRIATFVLSLVGLVVLAMVAVPSGVALYACGGLVITILAEVLAIRAASAAERTLELDKLANGDRKVSGECLALADAADLEEVGGKASALGKVASASLATRLFDVPGGVVFRNFEGLSIADDAKFNAAVLAHMKAKVPGAEAMKFAVRSSAPGEDSANESQAGRYVSVLNVTLDGIAEALRTVLTSYGEEAVKRGYRVGVLVQAMAPADLAGVMFTRSPGNGAVTHINYTEGLGDRLVSGEVAAKEIVVSRRSGVLRPKTSETRLAEKLFLAGQAIEKLFGRPQDIEWAYNRKEDKLYVLQSRPITVFEYDPAVLEEQEKHLATVPDLPRPEQVSRPVWKRSDVREVVENPSVLAASIVRRTYAKGGSLLVASDRLALGMGPVEVVSLFGQLYDKGGMSLLSNVRFALGMWRLKRGIEGSPWPAKLRAECEQPTPSTALDASEIRPLAAQLVAHVGVFLREVYPVAVEATILAKVATPEEPPKVHTISADMFASLVRAAESDDPSVFIKDWGQRSESDYDPAAPDFGEDVGALKAYAAGFRGMRVSDEVSSETPTAYSQLLQLKEISKDRAVRFLRRMRPAMLRLAALLKVAPSSVFVLPLESLEDLATGARSVDAIVAEIEDGVRREAAWKAVTLPDDVSVPDLEFLGQLAEEESEDASASSTSGKFVSAKNSFAGTVVHVSRITNDDDLTGAILVSDMLQPSLVKYFGKIAGIISERGAYLSHAAIVGREAGVPILILSKALSTVAHGSRVSVTVEGAVAVALSAAPAASLSPASIPGAMVAEAS